MTNALTAQQSAALAYYRHVEEANARHARGESAPKLSKRPKVPDPRVERALLTKGLIVQTGYHYGGLYALTDAGKAVSL